MRAAVAIILALLVVGVGGWALWDRIAVMAAPKKEAIASRSEAASKADELFWNTFHNGEYDKIQSALEVLTAAYLRTPNDAKTAAHIAWLHNWRIAERARMDSPPATITDDTIAGEVRGPVRQDGDEEQYRDVQFLIPIPDRQKKPIKAMSPSEITRVTGRNFFWARTMKVPYLDREESEKLIIALKALLSAD